MKTPRDKYLSDNHYRALVGVMVAQIEQCNFTPSEMREAALLASIMYEERHIREIKFILPELENALNTIHTWVKTPSPPNKSVEPTAKGVSLCICGPGSHNGLNDDCPIHG